MRTWMCHLLFHQCLQMFVSSLFFFAFFSCRRQILKMTSCIFPVLLHIDEGTVALFWKTHSFQLVFQFTAEFVLQKSESTINFRRELRDWCSNTVAVALRLQGNGWKSMLQFCTLVVWMRSWRVTDSFTNTIRPRDCWTATHSGACRVMDKFYISMNLSCFKH